MNYNLSTNLFIFNICGFYRILITSKSFNIITTSLIENPKMSKFLYLDTSERLERGMNILRDLTAQVIGEIDKSINLAILKHKHPILCHCLA